MFLFFFCYNIRRSTQYTRTFPFSSYPTLRPSRQRAPGWADDHRVVATAERLVERAGVEGAGRGLVAAVARHVRGPVAAQVGGDRAVARVSQRRQQVAPRVDRKSVGSGKRVPVRVDHRGCRILTKTQQKALNPQTVVTP